MRRRRIGEITLNTLEPSTKEWAWLRTSDITTTTSTPGGNLFDTTYRHDRTPNRDEAHLFTIRRLAMKKIVDY